MHRVAVSLLVLTLLWASGAHAYDALFEQLSKRAALSDLFPTETARAKIADGPLLGHGIKHTKVLEDGRLRVEQERTYTRIRNPETGQVAKLPEPWRTRVRLMISPQLRLLSADTKLSFERSADRLFEDYRISEERPELFEHDHVRVVASERGDELIRKAMRDGRVVERERYDYPANGVPIETVGIEMAAAVYRGVRRFDFDVLLPDGSSHGVRAVVHRTRDVAAFAEGYPIARRMLEPSEKVAVVEMRLASPIKRLVYPHQFFMMYAASKPARLLGMWGGEPGEHLQAFRVD